MINIEVYKYKRSIVSIPSNNNAIETCLIIFAGFDKWMNCRTKFLILILFDSPHSYYTYFLIYSSSSLKDFFNISCNWKWDGFHLATKDFYRLCIFRKHFHQIPCWTDSVHQVLPLSSLPRLSHHLNCGVERPLTSKYTMVLFLTLQELQFDVITDHG